MDGVFFHKPLARNEAVQAKIVQRRRERELERDATASAPDLSSAQTLNTPNLSGSDSPSSPSMHRTLSGNQLSLQRWDTTLDTTPMNKSAHSTSGSTSGASASTSGANSESGLSANPFELRYGRRYLKDIPYALPCDLAEMHRESLRTLLGVAAFDKAACAPNVSLKAPKKVLEIGCGSAYWTSSCHEYFQGLGSSAVSFTGVDIAPLAPDLKRQGIDWTFVRHDLRQMPWPFANEEFDYVMVKDMSLAVPQGEMWQIFMDECIRILAAGGALEIWESDHVLRSVSPDPPPPPPGTDRGDVEHADSTRTFLITPGASFPAAQDKHIQSSNEWIEAALAKRNLTSTPCARVASVLYQESDTLSDFGSRRVAIPLRELPWEKERLEIQQSRKHSRAGTGGKLTTSRSPKSSSSLTPEQAALRYTALLTTTQKIESLEPLLRHASGKNADEWSTWWASMMSSMFEGEGASSGECLEIGAWWATKRTV